MLGETKSWADIQAYTYQKQKCFLPVKKMEDQIVFSLV